MPIFELKFKKLHPNAKAPSKAYESDLGYDLCALEDVIIPPSSRAKVPTGIAFRFPAFIGGILKDRSGNAANFGLHVIAGVIDPSYTGEVKVVLLNTNTVNSVKLAAGDKIAQMLLLPAFQPSGGVVEVDDLGVTDRGEKGFGSSDVTT